MSVAVDTMSNFDGDAEAAVKCEHAITSRSIKDRNLVSRSLFAWCERRLESRPVPLASHRLAHRPDHVLLASHQIS